MSSNEKPIVFHYDGSSFTKQTAFETRGISGRSATDLWALGSATLRHFDGTAWATVDAGNVYYGVGVLATPSTLITNSAGQTQSTLRRYRRHD